MFVIRELGLQLKTGKNYTKVPWLWKYSVQIWIFLNIAQRINLFPFHDNFCLLSLISLNTLVLFDFWLTVEAATLIFISGRGSAISSAQEGKLGSIFLEKKS